MSWQEDLKQLDDELSSGTISIEEHRKRRDDLLASASSAASTGVTSANATAGHSPEAGSPAGAEPGTAETNPAEATTTETPTAGSGQSDSAASAPAAQRAQVQQATGQQATGQQAPAQPPPARPSPAPEAEAPEPEAPQSPAAQQQPAAQQADATRQVAPVEQAEQAKPAEPVPAAEQPPRPQPQDEEPTTTVSADQVAAAEPTSKQPYPKAAPPESAAERTAWVTRNPSGQQSAPWLQNVPKFPPRPEPPQQQSQPQQFQQQYPPQPNQQHYQQPFPQPGQQYGQQGARPGGPVPPAQWSQQPPGPGPGNAGEAWQPQWQRDWEPAPGGQPFDAFDPSPSRPNQDQFENDQPKKKDSSKILVISLVVVLVLGLAGFGVWWFLLRDNGNQNADGGPPKPVPTGINGMLAAIPKLPGKPNNEIGPTIPTDTGSAQGLYPKSTAEALIGQGTKNVVYKASVDGALQYGVLAVPSQRPSEISEAILQQQTGNGWQRAQEPGTPNGGTGLRMTKNGVTFHRVVYNAGKWTLFVGVSPDQAGDDATIRDSFGKVVTSVSKALPPS